MSLRPRFWRIRYLFHPNHTGLAPPSAFPLACRNRLPGPSTLSGPVVSASTPRLAHEPEVGRMRACALKRIFEPAFRVERPAPAARLEVVRQSWGCAPEHDRQDADSAHWAGPGTGSGSACDEDALPRQVLSQPILRSRTEIRSTPVVNPAAPCHASRPRVARSVSQQWPSFRADARARSACTKPHATVTWLPYGRPTRKSRQGAAAELRSSAPCRKMLPALPSTLPAAGCAEIECPRQFRRTRAQRLSSRSRDRIAAIGKAPTRPARCDRSEPGPS